MLEDLRLRELRGENEGVEARLVDDGHFLFSTDGVAKHDAIPLVLFVHMFVKSVSCVVVSQCLSHVLSHEPRFPVFFYSPDITEHLVMEIYQLVVHFLNF